jgi:cytochrome P450
MTDAQAHDEIMTVLLAGTETTAGTLSWILHVLSGNPELQREVQREADQVAGPSLPGPADLSALRFTRRLVTEVLRLYPAGWTLGRRPVEETAVADVTIPAGAQVLLNFYGLHRDPEIYADPYRFDPERWQDGETDPPRPHFLPFGLGPHACLGEGFAMSQILTTLAVVFSRYTVRPVPGAVVRPVARITLHPGVVPLIVEER